MVLVIISIALAFFLPATDFKAPLFYLRDTGVTTGYVVDNTPTKYNDSEDENHIWAYLYKYQIGLRTHLGLSYSSTLSLKKGDKVQVQYVNAQPECSRIKGTHNAPFSLWPLLVVSVITVGAGQLIWSGLERVRQIAAIATDAFVTTAICEKVFEDPNQDSDFATVYRTRYVYNVDGCAYIYSMETIKREKLGADRVIVLQGRAPTNAMLASELPIFIWERLKTVNP